MRWWPALASQGLLDTGGYAALYQAAYGEGSGVAAVVASSYGALSTLLAWIILRERVNAVQWAGIGAGVRRGRRSVGGLGVTVRQRLGTQPKTLCVIST